MALIIKHPHNYLCTFEKIDRNTNFHSIIDILSYSKYKTLLTADAPIYQDTLRDFWANAELEEQKGEPFGITSKVGGVLVDITPTNIPETFQMNDLAGKTSFQKNEFQTDLIERAYVGQLNKATMFKPNFPPPMKFLFHTLLTCLSNKTTAFIEIPLKIQYLGYAIFTKADFNYSQALFTDLVNILKKTLKMGRMLLFSCFQGF
ncbi:hypothetical protein Hanom_Chr08g00722691 [Helianthus anomalus]